MAKKRKISPQQRQAAEARRRQSAKTRKAHLVLSPAVAREKLFNKMRDMYWLMDKWDAPATSRRIDNMTDAQVYAALSLDEDKHESAVRTKNVAKSKWSSKDDPSRNVLWYHGGEKEAA